jgi:hypothetical protein
MREHDRVPNLQLALLGGVESVGLNERPFFGNRGTKDLNSSDASGVVAKFPQALFRPIEHAPIERLLLSAVKVDEIAQYDRNRILSRSQFRCRFVSFNDFGRKRGTRFRR